MSVECENFNEARSGTSLTANPKDERTFFRTTSVNLSYQPLPRLTVDVIIPHKDITAPKTDLSTGTRFTRHFSGLGDMIVFNRFQLNIPQSERSPRFSLGFGARLPTGNSRPDWDWGFGISRDPVLQTGGGSIDPIFGGYYSQKLGNVSSYGSLLYRLSGGENVHSYKFGSESQYTAGVAYRPFTGMRLSMQLNGIHTGHDYDKGIRVDNTGGDWLYLTPGVTIGHNGVSYQTTIQLPVYRYVNNAQLTSDYVFTLSAWYAFGGRQTSSQPLSTKPKETATPDKPDIATISLGEVVELEDFLVPNKIALFEFYSDTCTSCEALEPMLRNLVKSSPDVALRKINIGTGNSPVIQQYRIAATPEIRVFDRHGQFVETVVGPEIGLIESAISKARSQQPTQVSKDLFKKIQ